MDIQYLIRFEEKMQDDLLRLATSRNMLKGVLLATEDIDEQWKILAPEYIGKLNCDHRTGKDQFSFQFQRKAMPKNAQTTAQLHSTHMLVNNAQNSPSQASAICEP